MSGPAPPRAWEAPGVVVKVFLCSRQSPVLSRMAPLPPQGGADLARLYNKGT
jgi:hypothetical protein